MDKNQKTSLKYERLLRDSRAEDLSDIAKLGFIYKSGRDFRGRTIVVIVARHLPAQQVSERSERALMKTRKRRSRTNKICKCATFSLGAASLGADRHESGLALHHPGNGLHRRTRVLNRIRAQHDELQEPAGTELDARR